MRGRRGDGGAAGRTEPAEDTENPLLAEVDEADWPATPAGRQLRGRRAGRRAWSRDASRAGGRRPGWRRRSAPRRRLSAPASTGLLSDAERELVAAWELDTGPAARRAGAAQRARGDGPVEVLLPARLSVSALVALARDPDELARQVRRPMPRPPARQARRGTAFHLWLEERFGQQRLIGDDDLFAEDDEDDRTTT